MHYFLLTFAKHLGYWPWEMGKDLKCACTPWLECYLERRSKWANRNGALVHGHCDCVIVIFILASPLLLFFFCTRFIYSRLFFFFLRESQKAHESTEGAPTQIFISISEISSLWMFLYHWPALEWLHTLQVGTLQNFILRSSILCMIYYNSPVPTNFE